MSSTDRIVPAITSEEIIARMKADLKNKANKIEGSFASDNIQAVGKEMASLYGRINYLNDMHYTETAEGEWLDKDGKEHGVDRKEATSASGQVTFYGQNGINIPAGTIVSGGGREYKTTEYVTISGGQATSKVIAVNTGAIGNVDANVIQSFENLQGINSVVNLEAIKGGTDEESDEDYRERILLKKRYPGTSGNKYHYMHWAMEVEGVGRVKVFPLWDGAGTVKVSILDSNQKKANEELIQKVKTHIDGDAERNGESLAQIGALLTVTTAEEVGLNIAGQISVREGSYASPELIAEAFKTELQIYIDREISYKQNKLTVAKVIDILYSVEGVEDIEELTVNSSVDTIRIGEEQILTVESVVFNG